MDSAELFLLEPKNRLFLQGEGPYVAGRPPLGCFIVPVVLAAVAVAACGLGAHWGKKAASLKAHRALAQGRVVHRRIHTSPGTIDLDTGVASGDETDYLVEYRFSADTPVGPREFAREASVPKEDYNKWRPNDPLQVVFDKSDPANSFLPEEGPPFQHVTLIIAGGSLLALCILGEAFLATLWRRNRSLNRFGEVLPGRLNECTGARNEDGPLTIHVKYAFSSPAGREITATASAGRGDLTETTLPAPRTPVRILYCHDDLYELL